MWMDYRINPASLKGSCEVLSLFTHEQVTASHSKRPILYGQVVDIVPVTAIAWYLM